ncbi:hypothetical protein ACHHYP_07028 [Achlya hypogyna]|uniref:Uncharacterized protein n=1 Tax=Achlya hypogyna TaxID=1202772 RepID=A0A1V9YR20_ACHHY|nr:hypothetical protein ACHHYP_07028 [Achlya hypogyna]
MELDTASAAVLRSLSDACADCICGSLAASEVPALEVDGVSNVLSWPLYTEERDLLVELFHGDDRSCVVVPAAQLSFEDNIYEPFTAAIEEQLRDDLGPVTAELSHLVVDSGVGTSSGHLLARSPSDDSVGTLLVLVPSIDGHAGGNVSITPASGQATCAELLTLLIDESPCDLRPFARECIKVGWYRVLAGTTLIGDMDFDVHEWAPAALLQHGLRLDAFIVGAEETWIGHRLPPTLVGVVDAFLAPTTLPALVRAFPRQCHPIKSVAVAVDALRGRSEVLARATPLLDELWTQFPSCLAADEVLDDYVLAALVRVAVASNKLPVVLEHAPDHLGKYVLPALVPLLSSTTPPVVAVSDLVGVTLDIMTSDHHDEEDISPQDVEMVLADEFSIVHAMLVILVAGADEAHIAQWQAYVRKRVAIQSDAVDYARYVLAPLHSEPVVAGAGLQPWVAALALPPLQRRVCSQALPPSPTWTLPAMTLPCECTQCSAVVAFLRDGEASQLVLTTRAPCPIFVAFEESLSAVVTIDDNVRGDKIVLEKDLHRVFHERQLELAAIANMQGVASPHVPKRPRLTT